VSVMNPGPARHRRGGNWWETVRYALDDWPRTARLCVIILVSETPPTLLAVLIRLLIRH
jgi:hypothetical protein